MMIRALLLAAALLSYGADPEHNGPAPVTDMAKVWLTALQTGRSIPMSGFSAFPFTYREAWAKKRCTQTAADADGLVPLVECTHEREEPLILALRAAAQDRSRLHLASGLAGASKRLRGLAGSASKAAWINGWVRGDGVRYDFLFALTNGDANTQRIKALFIDSSLEPR